MSRAPSGLRFGRALATAGTGLAVVGLLPWLALVVGADGADSWSLLVLATVALLGGTFLALVGAGMLRQVSTAQQLQDQRALDDAVVAASDSAQACGETCSTCTASCALHALQA